MWEFLEGKKKRKRPIARKNKTDWEKNLTKLRSKERALDANSPVKPVKTS